MKHPKKWYIPVTEENQAELDRWRQSVATSHRANQLRPNDSVLLSKHIADGSHYFADAVDEFRRNPRYNDYQEITLEQFREIINQKPMKHPEEWYIPVTQENRAELQTWWRKQVLKSVWTYDTDARLREDALLLSEHPTDLSYYWGASETGFTERYPSYKKITLEQFREITNPKPMKHPEKWYIPTTQANHDELQAWWQKQALKSGWTSNPDSCLPPDALVLSQHPGDHSHYYAGSESGFKANNPSYQEINLEQFRQITNSNQTQTTMSKQIQISRELLNEYYNAATTPQKEYLTEHFKLDGTTTVEAIRGLHDLACSTWKPKIKRNHPDCFPEDSKYFDFSKHAKQGGSEIVSADVYKSLGLAPGFIQVRNNTDNPKTHHQSFYLSSYYNWELVQDGTEEGRPVMALIPTKKQPK
jgi:hypothetical protein